jgi:hypothetical protein
LKIEKLADLTDPNSDAYKLALKTFNESGGYSWNEDAMEGRTSADFDPSLDSTWEMFDSPQAGVQEALREAGYDGVKLGEYGSQSSYAVFDPDQVKSATGNNGDFNPEKSNALEQSLTTMVPWLKGATIDPTVVKVPGLEHATGEEPRTQAVLAANVDTFSQKEQTVAGKIERGYDSITPEGDTPVERAHSIVRQMVRNLLSIYDAIPEGNPRAQQAVVRRRQPDLARLREPLRHDANAVGGAARRALAAGRLAHERQLRRAHRRHPRQPAGPPLGREDDGVGQPVDGRQRGLEAARAGPSQGPGRPSRSR